MANNKAVAKPSFFISITSLLKWIKQGHCIVTIYLVNRGHVTVRSELLL